VPYGLLTIHPILIHVSFHSSDISGCHHQPLVNKIELPDGTEQKMSEITKTAIANVHLQKECRVGAARVPACIRNLVHDETA
jgi:hypothetical protein